MKYLVLPLLLFIFLSLGALGAEESQEQVKRTCRILFPNKPAEALKEVYLFDGTSSQKIDLPSMNFSEVIELPVGELTLGLCGEARNASQGFPEKAPTVSLADTVTDFLLLVNSDPNNPHLLVALTVIDTSRNRLNPGETLWINYTQHNILARLGKDELTIPPMKRSICRPSFEKSGYYKAVFKYQQNAEGAFLPIMRKSWWHDATSKNLGFIVETNARLPKIFTIRDHRN